MRERLYEIILGPHISEKSTIAAEKNRQFVFRVVPSANKIEVKQAVEALFKVKVEKVCMSCQKGKTRRHGQITGRRNHAKKAYVRLQEGQDIEFTGTA